MLTYSQAVDIIARRMVVAAAISAEWEDYPDIGDADFDVIVYRAEMMVSDPTGEEYTAAYRYFAARAEQAKSVTD